MPLGQHTKNPVSKRIRKERSDSLIKNLKKEYPILQGQNGNMQLGTLEERLGVNSLSQVLKRLREEKK